MNQIITQHGWGLDSSIWSDFSRQFNTHGWVWQNNERGYFYKSSKSSTWFKNNSQKQIRMAICHSLGTHLIKKETISKASHIVLINSFYNFIPRNPHNRKFTLRALNRMRNKLVNNECREMLQEFITKSYSPKHSNYNLEDLSNINLQSINKTALINDFDKLFISNRPKKLFSDSVELLILNSEKDKILDKEVSNEFIQMLSETQIQKIKIIELKNQGHLINKINLFQIIQEWLNE